MKRLTISEEAYARLEAHKRRGERFSDTILRLTGGEQDLMRGFGSMADVKGFRATVDASHERLDADLDDRSGR